MMRMIGDVKGINRTPNNQPSMDAPTIKVQLGLGIGSDERFLYYWRRYEVFNFSTGQAIKDFVSRHLVRYRTP